MARLLDFTFDGFARPSYTQVPDELFDELITQLSEAELRVLLYIVRRTFGFKRDADTISLSQLMTGITTREGQVLDRGTGLSKATVARGLKGLREKGVIESQRNRSVQRGDEPTTYRLRFKQGSATPEKPKPLSRQRDRSPVSRAKQALSRPRDTQETVEQETAFDYSKWETIGETTGVGERLSAELTASHRPQTGSDDRQTPSTLSEGSLAAILQHRVRRDVNRADRTAIGVTIERFAGELGDQADPKVSISRALHLYQASGVSVHAFVDLLYQAKGETLDRRNFPGKAPIPRNRMAYFFALVEDRLGLRSNSGRSAAPQDPETSVMRPEPHSA